MSASSMTVSPWSERTRGSRHQADSAVAYAPFGPKHCTWRTSGRNASTAARREPSVCNPVVAVRRIADQLVAGRGIGMRRTTSPSRISAVSAARSSGWPVQTSTSSPAATRESARWRLSSSTPPREGGYELGSERDAGHGCRLRPCPRAGADLTCTDGNSGLWVGVGTVLRLRASSGRATARWRPARHRWARVRSCSRRRLRATNSWRSVAAYHPER